MWHPVTTGPAGDVSTTQGMKQIAKKYTNFSRRHLYQRQLDHKIYKHALLLICCACWATKVCGPLEHLVVERFPRRASGQNLRWEESHELGIQSMKVCFWFSPWYERGDLVTQRNVQRAEGWNDNGLDASVWALLIQHVNWGIEVWSADWSPKFSF